MKPLKHTALLAVITSGPLVLLAPDARAEKPSPNADTLRSSAETAFKRGDFEGAIQNWTQAQNRFQAGGKLRDATLAAANLGAAYQFAGQPAVAESVLLQGLKLANSSGDKTLLVPLENNLGGLYMQMGQPEAEKYLKTALDTAQDSGDSSGAARAWNNLGNFYASQDRAIEAQRAYGSALPLASGKTAPELAAQIRLNLATSAFDRDDNEQALILGKDAENAISGLDDSFTKVQLLLALGDLRTQMARQSRNRVGLTSQAIQNETAALKAAEAIGDTRSASLANGMLGTIAERDGRLGEAIALTRRARFLAQQTQTAHLLYRWEWQLGRLFKAQGLTQEAVSAFRRAITTYGTMSDCATGIGASGSAGKNNIRPLYYGLADLLLKQAAQEGADAQPLLMEARETVEKLKSAELVDYFQDTCVSAALSKVKDVDSLLTDAAAIYYIPLPDRTEILLAGPTGLQRFSSPVSDGELAAKVRRFRLHLQHSGSGQYLPYSQDLYNLLIRPIEPALAANHVRTLVLVPDGTMRTIPLAALNDGKQFLIENYSVAVTPGLTLMDPRPLQRGGAAVLVGGLSQSVQGHDALTSVQAEVKSIEADFSTTAILNKDFVKPVLKEEFLDGNFSIVHIASHGEFTGSSDKSYLLTYDSKLTVNDLEQLIRPRQYRGAPVEMLFLSACQTAAGDDRAALGLAGIAIKSGARSALASLWSVNDQATARLVSEFYGELKRNPTETKAEALRKAQLVLLHDKDFSEPMFWSPFQVIGNWY